MNRPGKFATGSQRAHEIKSCLLAVENFRYHLEVYSLPHGGKPVVMWTDGAVQFEGHQAGDHDGLRDGAHSGRTDFSANYCRYATQEEWIAAGNELPN